MSVNKAIIGSDNGVPSHYLTQCWLLDNWISATNFSVIWIKIKQFSFAKINLKLSSEKWQQFCFSLNVSKVLMTFRISIHSLRSQSDNWTSPVWWYILTNITRTTRMPAFWDTPRGPMFIHTSDSHHLPSQKKTKSMLQIAKNCQNFKFWNFARNFTCDTPSEVAW